MGLVRQVEVRLLDSVRAGMVEFYPPQASHETMLVQVAPNTVDDLFVHRFQTDQLMVVRGAFVLVILKNRQYEYIPLSDRHPQLVTIPAGVPHGAINLSNESCLVVNAVLRHGTAHPKDYQPLRQPFPYDMAAARARFEELELPLTA